MRPPPVRYFPVKPGVLRMRARLMDHGTPAAAGEVERRDQLYFQLDDERDAYLEEKQTLAQLPGRFAIIPEAVAVHDAVLAWMEARVAAEHPGLVDDAPASPLERYARIAYAVQEDFVILERVADGDRAVGMFVCFPGAWRPEALLGASFLAIHARVPGFVESPEAAASMVSAMIDRGPYVRFLWSAVPDPWLDHHPEQGRRLRWTDPGDHGWLRVERQVTVPFPAVEGSLFLIRTYVYPFESLSLEERRLLAEVVDGAPEEVRRYKRFLGNEAEIRRRLGL